MAQVALRLLHLFLPQNRTKPWHEEISVFVDLEAAQSRPGGICVIVLTTLIKQGKIERSLSSSAHFSFFSRARNDAALPSTPFPLCIYHPIGLRIVLNCCCSTNACVRNASPHFTSHSFPPFWHCCLLYLQVTRHQTARETPAALQGRINYI